MRTTITLEDGLAARLRERALERNLSFKAVVNDAIRAGLDDSGPEPEPFRVHARPMGVKAGVDVTKALQLAADLEDAEIVRKLELGR